MTRRNSLMEWIDQVKKYSKASDYLALDAIDSVFDVLWAVDFRILKKHQDLFDDVCGRYHKPNPLHFDHNQARKETFFEKKNGTTVQEVISGQIKKQFHGHAPEACFGNKDWRSCGLARFGIDLLSKFVDSSMTRIEGGMKDAVWAWFEVIDFMWERPELINPNSIDEYVEERINYVCKNHRKENPLTSKLRERFGKFWRDGKGTWHKERRKRL